MVYTTNVFLSLKHVSWFNLLVHNHVICSIEEETKEKRDSEVKANLHKSTKEFYQNNTELFPREHNVHTTKRKAEPHSAAPTHDMSNFVEEVASLIRTAACQFHFTHRNCTALVLYNEECLIDILSLSDEAYFIIHT